MVVVVVVVVVEGQVVTVTTAAAVATAAVATLNKLLLNFVATDLQCSSSFADQHWFWCLVLDPGILFFRKGLM